MHQNQAIKVFGPACCFAFVHWSSLNWWTLVHRNYWRDLFILKHLFRDTLEDPNSPEESGGGNLKEESSSKGWSDQRETVDGELPLTFTDMVMVRNFSRKAKKIWKKLAMMIAAFYFSLHAFRCKCNWWLWKQFLLLSYHFILGQIISYFFTLQKVPKLMIVLCWDGKIHWNGYAIVNSWASP